jgi:hypothetical protein
MEQDQIIDATMARSIQADMTRKHPLLAWIITQDQDDHDGQFVARLVANEPTLYVMLADTLAELQAQLPRSLERVDRHSFRPREVVEIWFVPNNLKAPAPARSPSPLERPW